MRNAAWRRKKNYSKAIRKLKIYNKLYYCPISIYYQKHKMVIGMLIKGKVHSSNPMYARKTRSRRRYGSILKWSHHDQKKLEDMDYQFSAFLDGLEEL